MTDRPNLDRLVTDWLRAGAPPRAPERVLTAALDRVAVIGQERPFGSRPFGNRPLGAWVAASRQLRVVALVLVVLAALLAAIVGAGALLRRQAPVPPQGGANGWVAYSQHAGASGDDARNGQVDLYVVRAGSLPLKVAGFGGESGSSAVRAVCPSFSPDGTRLAFAESRNPTLANDNYDWATRAVVVLTLDATGRIDGPSVRIPVPGSGDDPCPEWTPGGGALVFRTGVSGSFATARVSDPTTLVPIGGAESISDVRAFAVSPDGQTIATAGQSGIWLLPIGGGTPRYLYGSAIVGNIAWSPDGTRIIATIAGGVLAGGLGGDPTTEVVGLDRTSKTVGSGYGPVWSPDGKRIAFENSSQTGIVVANPDGSAPHVIAMTSLGLPSAGATILFGCVWSPDSSHLVFASDVGLISASATGDPADQVLVTASGYAVISQTGMSWQPVYP
jgi:hypothetical protein